MTATLAAALVRTTGWTERAACADADPELFAPRAVGRAEVYLDAVAVAQRYCASCPVIAQCAAEADRDGLQGVWGGSNRYRDSAGRGHVQVVPLIPAAPTPRKASS